MATTLQIEPEVRKAPQSTRENILQVARSFVPRLREGQAESDRQARVPQELAEELQDAGMLSLGIPSAYGGLELDLSVWMDVLTEIGRGDGGVSWALMLVNTCNWTLPTVFPRHIVDEVFDKPNTNVAGVFAARTIKARPAPGGIFVEHGTWMFNSGVDLAQWDLLGVPIFNDGGELVSRGIALVPMSDVKVLSDWDTIGLRGSGSHNVTMQDVFIPSERIVEMRPCFEGRYAGDFQDVPIFNAAFMPLTAIVLTFPVLGVGMHMIEEILEKMPSRNIPYTAYAKSGEAAVTHLQLGEASAKIEAAKLMVEKCCRDIDMWAARREPMPFMDRARQRLYTGGADRLVWEAMDLLASTGGGSFARRSSLLNRLWQDVRVANMHGIAAPASNFELYGRLLCGMDANQMMV